MESRGFCPDLLAFISLSHIWIENWREEKEMEESLVRTGEELASFVCWLAIW